MIERYNHCDDNLHAGSLNVRTNFKGNTVGEVRSELSTARSQMINICMNLTGDFNKASVIRSSNAFAAREVYLVGKKRYDRRGAVGTHHFENVYHADTLAEVRTLLKKQGYKIFAVDNTAEFKPKPLWDTKLPFLSAFVYGEEQRGLSHNDIELCDDMIFIPQRGSVPSINVACAASIIMAEYSRQNW